LASAPNEIHHNNEHPTMKVLGISGSLRQGSFNTMALRAAQKLAPAGMEITVADISRIPLYNDDVRVAGEPAEVSALKAQIRAADAVLLVTPEYNFSIPGVLKNTLDWMSRPPEPPFDGKVVAIMGASPGPVGTARVQYDLRKVLVFMNGFTVNKPEVFISFAQNKFNAQGELTDEPTAKFIVDLLVSLQNLKKRVG
jgi:chromate reductase, NAD(P)H dehydrogenase (quinone)